MTGLVFGGLFALIAGGALGGLAGTLALLLQVLAIGLVVWLVLAFFRSRRSAEPALAGAGQAMARAPLQQVPAASVTPVVNPHVSDQAPPDDIGIKGEDFNAFERMLGEVLTTYGAGDRAKLATLAAPNMAQSLNENLDENAKKDLVNHITNVKLLQGDLSEAWREGEVEYATVAMRYQLADGMFSTESGRWISGSKSETDLQQVVEHWTFVRKAGAKPGEGWKLTMIGEA
jgi:predicted lipid-binding transport protein (Tim44 family)